jgi:excinuclease ABC subunit C
MQCTGWREIVVPCGTCVTATASATKAYASITNKRPIRISISGLLQGNRYYFIQKMLSTLENKIKKLPQSSGVYFFFGARKEILYIGKATSLRSRVRSYFTGDILDSRSPLIAEMIGKIKLVDYRETDSVLEALILEANLIKTHKPRYNTEGKDSKSFNYVVITNEEWPRVLTVRGHDLYQKFEEREIKQLFGPFPQGGIFKEAMKLIRKIFPFYDTKHPVEDMVRGTGKGNIEFNQQIGVYPSPETTKEDYVRTIRYLRLFLEGKKKQLLSQLKHDMKRYAKLKEFEKAEIVKRRIFGIEHIQDVSLMKEEFRRPGVNFEKETFRIESYDVAHMGGRDTVGVMTVIENSLPKKSDYRKFKIKAAKEGDDVGSLKEMLSRRLGHPEWQLPKLIVVDGGKAQKNATEKILNAVGVKIPVVGVVKDEHHKPREIVGNKDLKQRYEKEILIGNAEAHRFALSFHKNLRDRI